jgi:hypothetical protein
MGGGDGLLFRTYTPGRTTMLKVHKLAVGQKVQYLPPTASNGNEWTDVVIEKLDEHGMLVVPDGTDEGMSVPNIFVRPYDSRDDLTFLADAYTAYDVRFPKAGGLPAVLLCFWSAPEMGYIIPFQIALLRASEVGEEHGYIAAFAFHAAAVPDAREALRAHQQDGDPMSGLLAYNAAATFFVRVATGAASYLTQQVRAGKTEEAALREYRDNTAKVFAQQNLQAQQGYREVMAELTNQGGQLVLVGSPQDIVEFAKNRTIRG